MEDTFKHFLISVKSEHYPTLKASFETKYRDLILVVASDELAHSRAEFYPLSIQQEIKRVLPKAAECFCSLVVKEKVWLLK